jgi:peptide/nickel transport system substrate-binding protein
MTSFTRSVVRRPALALAALALAVGSLTGCGGASAAGGDTTLDIQFAGPPITGLDPAKSGGGGSMIYSTLAYDPLIFMQPDGTLVPDLAESWRWADDGYTAFELTLRTGVKFSDGTEMTAEGVAQWLKYFKEGKATQSSNLATMTEARAVDAATVQITLSEPDPDFPALLSQQYPTGLVAAPAGMNEPGSLDAATNGTGPYTLDPAETVTGDHYTYVPNPHYWNPNGIVYDKVVVHVISDPNTIVSAMSAGQLDIALGSPSTATTAESAGIEVQSVPGRVVGLYLLDREGTLAPELGDVKVRQAINYAIDRESISAALNPDGFADPTSQMGLPQQVGFDPALDTIYPYDPQKARQLLAEAGHPDGISFEVTCASVLNLCPYAEAVATSLASAGITMTINEESEVSSFNQKFAGGEAPAVMFQSAGPAFRMARGLTRPDVLANPFDTQDPEIEAAYQQLATTGEDAAGPAWQALVRLLADRGWFAPVERPHTVVFSKGVDNVTVTERFPGYYAAIDPTGTHTWRPAP